MKYEWRKREKDIYLPNKKPTFLDDSKKWYITVNGVGHPDRDTFRLHIELLNALSDRIRMPKSGITPDGYYEYTVYPLEGIWDLIEAAKKLDYLDKTSSCIN